MRISFVIPAYNEEKRLPACLEAVDAELSRTPCEYEVVVVNNASTDRTAEVARRYPFVRVVDEPRKGLTRAREAGFVATTGDIIANIDADTRLPEGWLAKVLKEFKKHDDLVALSGPYIYYDLPLSDRVLVRLFYVGGYISHLINHYLVGGGAMLQGGNFIVRRTAMEAIGGFDTTIEFYGEDTDVARRISKMGKVKWTFALPMYASGRRLAKEGVFSTGWKYATNYFHTLVRAKPHTQTYTDIRDT